ncbi:MAG: hypothetical protein JWO95_709 [Verrucomicrobiales bacterium]|nr:hypothetical protein [Verrucomicrobiales bacterium]
MDYERNHGLRWFSSAALWINIKVLKVERRNELASRDEWQTVCVVKRRWKILLIGSILLVVLGLIPVTLHFRAKWKLDAYRNELIRKGEQIEAVQLIPQSVRNGAANGAHLINVSAAVGNRLRELLPFRMQIVAPGKARLTCRETAILENVNATYVPEATKSPGGEIDIVPLFESEVAAKRDLLIELRDATAGPMQFPINYAKGMVALLPHLAPLKEAAMNLCALTAFDLRKKHTDEATADLLAEVRLIGNWQHEPMLISELVRCACVTLSCCSTWEAVESHQLSETQLRQVQQSWEELDLLTKATASMKFEAVVNAQTIEAVRSDKDIWTGGATMNRLNEFGQLVTETLSEPKAGFKQLLDRYPRYWAWCWVGSYEDDLRTRRCVEDICQQIRMAQLWKGSTLYRRGEDGLWELGSESVFSWATGNNATLRRSAAKLIQNQSLVSLTVTAIALERYRLQHLNYPATLDELVPSLLKRVPVDYIDGKPVRYRSLSNGSFLLYSVGVNGVDDGGDATPMEGSGSSSFLMRKDLVWPQVASADEVKAFDEKKRGR